MAQRSRPSAAVAREREGQAFELRKAGATFAAIGRQIGISDVSALQAYRRALKRHPSPEQSAEGRALEAARLDQLMVGIWPRAIRGDEKALDRVLKIIELRCRLLGLELAPPPTTHVFIQQLYTELRALPEADLLRLLGYDPEVSQGEPAPSEPYPSRALPGAAEQGEEGPQ